MIGQTISHYRILKKIGQGGMGEVFLAYDSSLDRNVAAKFLPEDVKHDPAARLRFLREARSAAALDHSYICSIHEVGEAEGKSFIIMEFVDGQTLKDRLATGPVQLKEAMEWAREIAEALAVAHEKGIIHRDLKPSNIMLPRAGHVKVMDFGLAKQLFADSQIGSQETTLTGLTKEGTTVGTLPYMSPEQVHGSPVDHRSDLFSLGIVIYEMLTGVNPFRKASGLDTANSITRETVAPVSDHRDGVPQQLVATINKLLAKKPDERYQQAREVATALQTAIEEAFGQQIIITRPAFAGLRKAVKKPVYMIPLILALTAGAFFSVRGVRSFQKTKWAREVLPQEVERLTGTAKIADMITAFNMVRDARDHVRSNPALDELWNQVSREFKVTTEPAEAGIYVKPYDKPDDPWQLLGTSPFTGRVAFTWWRFKFEKQGYESVYAATHTYWDLSRTLEKKGSIPGRMARISDRPSSQQRLPDYYLDQYEVTNKQFSEFVRAGGYQKREYWKYPFSKDGKSLSWKEGISLMTDSTGRPGPSSWLAGDYPEGKDDSPVSGVSWYEAAAYAEFMGKSLPTIRHWVIPNQSPSGESALSSIIIPLSNFGTEGPVRVGGRQGINFFGLLDMAGNVREWCWNATPSGRSLRGGAWNDILYMYGNISQADPFDRSAKNGFRCAQFPGEVPKAVFEPYSPLEAKDYYHIPPVSDEAFQGYLRLFQYDKTDLKAESKKVEDTSVWTKLRVTFDAAYGQERMIAYLWLPKNASPPFQTVIFFPGSPAITRPKASIEIGNFNFLIKAGRAVMLPIYKGTYERADTDYGKTLLTYRPHKSHKYTEYLTMWVKDLRRSVDYLETCSEIDCSRLAFYGFSWGGYMTAPMPAIEGRLRANIVYLGGFPARSQYGDPFPEADTLTYVTRVTIPTLMLNGKYDLTFPYQTNVKPYFDLLGTPAKDKIQKLYDTDHYIPKNELIKECLAFLDRYLGPVKLTR